MYKFDPGLEHLCVEFELGIIIEDCWPPASLDCLQGVVKTHICSFDHALLGLFSSSLAAPEL